MATTYSSRIPNSLLSYQIHRWDPNTPIEETMQVTVLIRLLGVRPWLAIRSLFTDKVREPIGPRRGELAVLFIDIAERVGPRACGEPLALRRAVTDPPQCPHLLRGDVDENRSSADRRMNT